MAAGRLARVGSVAAVILAFGGTRVSGEMPTWPDNAVPQQFHLDLHVDDLNEAAAYAESIGARRATSGDHSPNFIVFLDPSGHPFCLCA